MTKEYQANPKRKYTLAWFPGAKDSLWSQEMDKAFLNTIDRNKFEILHGGFAELTAEKQRELLEKAAFKTVPDIMVGNAVFASLMARKMTANPHFRPKIYSSYYTNQIEEYIRNSSILATPTNFPVHQAIIAVDLAIRVLEKRPYPYEVGPKVQIITPKNLDEFKNKLLTHPLSHRHYLKGSF